MGCMICGSKDCVREFIMTYIHVIYTHNYSDHLSTQSLIVLTIQGYTWICALASVHRAESSVAGIPMAETVPTLEAD